MSNIISQAKLKKSSEHVFYEVMMLFFAIYELANIANNPLIKHNFKYSNAFLEVFTIHLRNLLDFFYTSSKNRKLNDDILAEDYLKYKENIRQFKYKRIPFQKVKHMKTKVNKQVVHLSYHRNKYNKRTKPWPFGEIYCQLYSTVIAFYDALPKDLKEWNYFIELKKVIDEYQKI